ncbi:hypothetical protein JXO52_06085 [bacterium]|nr:hypothetical protein [bacterium]
MPEHEDRITHILLANCERLKQLPGVVGVGRGVLNGAPCITLFLTRLPHPSPGAIPESLEGIPVVTEVRGNPDKSAC